MNKLHICYRETLRQLVTNSIILSFLLDLPFVVSQPHLTFLESWSPDIRVCSEAANIHIALLVTPRNTELDLLKLDREAEPVLEQHTHVSVMQVQQNIKGINLIYLNLYLLFSRNINYFIVIYYFNCEWIKYILLNFLPNFLLFVLLYIASKLVNHIRRCVKNPICWFFIRFDPLWWYGLNDEFY